MELDNEESRTAKFVRSGDRSTPQSRCIPRKMECVENLAVHFVDYMTALKCCLENLVQNPRYSFVSPFLYVLYFNHCHTFFSF